MPLHTSLEFSERTLPLVCEKLQAIQNEVERLKKSREKMEVKIPKEYEKAIKELTRILEERKRKEKGMVI
ncbi:MAG: hypothetical protein ABIM02_07330 [candidate division WOR-3 bacterium]